MSQLTLFAVCPYCRKKSRIRVSVAVFMLKPAPGSWYLCPHCIAVSIHGEDRKLRPPTAGESMKLWGSELGTRIDAARRMVVMRRRLERIGRRGGGHE